MRLAKAVTKATQAEFESMTQVAAKLGRETSFTAKQVADGMVALGRMGFSPKEVEDAIAPTLDLARATGTELGEAADIAANSMRIFGIEAERMSDVADVLTATANGSAHGGERDRISEVQAAYTRAESLVDKYSGKLREAQSGTRSAAEKSSGVNGSFLAAALNAALRSSCRHWSGSTMLSATKS